MSMKSSSPLVDTGETPPLQKHFLTRFLGKKVPRIPSEEEKRLWPRTPKRLILYIFFWWLIPIMKVGYKRTLENTDLFNLTDSLTVEALYADFIRHLDAAAEKNRERALKENPDLEGEELIAAGYTNNTIPVALYKALYRSYGLLVVFKVFFDVSSCLTPLIVKSLIDFVERKTLDKLLRVNKGVGYAIGTCCLVLFGGICINHFFCNSMIAGVQAKAVLTKLILEKLFKLDGKGRQKFPSGKITSIMGTDLARVDLATSFQPFLLTFPIPVGIVIVLLLVNIGVSALVGIAIFFCAVFFIGALSKKLVHYRKLASIFTDKRVSLVKEVLGSIKMIKYYGWEVPYHENISELRREEVKNVFRLQFIRVVFSTVGICLPMICSVVSFLVLYALHPNKSPAAIFSSLTLFNTLSQQVFMIPLSLGTSIDAYLGLKRVKELIMCGEEEHYQEEKVVTECAENGLILDENMAVQIRNGEFKWEAVRSDEELENPEKEKKQTEETEVDASTFTGLHSINLDIRKGEFVIVTGSIGSGKLSLLQALAGFMPKVGGAKILHDKLLLCGYPWVQNATVKNNILFGLPYDEARYKKTIEVCSLEADLAMLPAGENTEVGERGITLSGGQKARINLARAVYNCPDTILLDDVLSAVDARVGRHIMESCIMGFLDGKTRILATHQLSLIGYADRVIYVSDGGISTGTVDELLASNEGFKALMEFSNHKSKDEEDEEKEEEEEEKEEEAKQRAEHGLGQNGTLMQAEDRAVNKIPFLTYYKYAKMGIPKVTWLGIVGFLLIVICTTFLQLFTNTWLSFWTEKKFQGRSNGWYIGLYVMFCALLVIFAAVQFYCVAKFANTAAREMNIRAMEKVFYTTMSFLDTTPMGRILNRFTKDTDGLDNEIADQLRLFVYLLATVVGVLILAIIYQPWLAIAVPFLGFIYISITSFFQASAREIKRLEALNRSKVYNNFNECLSGCSTIKAYRLENQFMVKNDTFINGMNEALYVNVSIQRFLSIHFDMIATLVILIVSMLCVTGQFNILASLTGLVLSYLLQIVGLLLMLVRLMTQTENEMNLAERLLYYAYELPREAPYYIEDKKPEASWPQKGEILFDHVNMRYRAGLPLVLHDLQFTVRPGEKVGICGRTGAGKSSLMTALYRLAELDLGKIVIDGVDISQIGLADLRSKLCIIPQDPVLFKGTIRKNLDPFGAASDDQLWDALRRSGLMSSEVVEREKNSVQSKEESSNDNEKSPKTTQDEGSVNLDTLHKFHLDQLVEDEGANFSLGERQLIALARALVRESKILILDEATSSVDYETDAKINETIRTEFADCTILCIAHRLNTIVNFDRILVMDAGSVAEYDTPKALYQHNGIFKEMCDRSGIVID